MIALINEAITFSSDPKSIYVRKRFVCRVRCIAASCHAMRCELYVLNEWNSRSDKLCIPYIKKTDRLVEETETLRKVSRPFSCNWGSCLSVEEWRCDSDGWAATMIDDSTDDVIFKIVLNQSIHINTVCAWILYKMIL